jgi:hypothetical protein
MELLDQLETENPEDQALAPNVRDDEGFRYSHEHRMLSDWMPHAQCGLDSAHCMQMNACCSGSCSPALPCPASCTQLRVHIVRCLLMPPSPVWDYTMPPLLNTFYLHLMCSSQQIMHAHLPGQCSCCVPQDLSEWACIYIKYIQILRKLEMAYDQIVHPQKRIDMKKAVEACIGRILEIRQVMVRALPCGTLQRPSFSSSIGLVRRPTVWCTAPVKEGMLTVLCSTAAVASTMRSAHLPCEHMHLGPMPLAHSSDAGCVCFNAIKRRWYRCGVAAPLARR